ncbi:uncharacterized protein LOC134726659 [Mytilus trossulus]|uniref:uncharacterized protein LOC134726659 n=1 Tax=Mytilus trossulus TaxID=6551 RepID=UPI0030041AE2
MHQNHTLCEIDDAYEDKLSDIENLNLEVESNIAFLKNEERLLQECESKGRNHHIKFRTLIRKREDDMKQGVAMKTKDILDELETEWLTTEESINNDIELCSKTKSQLLKRKENIHSSLTSHDPGLVFDECLDNITQSHQPMVDKRASLFQFFPKVIETKGILGDLIEKPKIDSFTVYPTDMKYVSCLSHCEGETVLICNSYEDILKKEDLNYDTYKTLKTLKDIKVRDMSQTKDGHSILSVGEDLKILTKTGQLKTFFYLNLITLCVHVNKENELFVGALVKDPNHEGEKLGIVVVSDQHRNIKNVFDKRKIESYRGYTYYDDSFDEDEIVDMFDYPSRILNTRRDDLLIIDNTDLSTYAGKVVLLNRSGEREWLYNGCECENCYDFEFCPFDIAETHSNLFLISDVGKHSIHVLGKTLLTCSFVDDIGIDYPLSLCIDAAGKLWIGCDMSGDDDEEPKIYCITFS